MNNFTQFPDWFEEARKKGLKGDDATLCRTLLRAGNRTGDESANDFHGYATLMWRKLHKPYVKVYPSVALELATAKVDLPFSDLTMPFDAFSILLNDDLLTDDSGQQPVRSMLVSQVQPKTGNPYIFISAFRGKYRSGIASTPAFWMRIDHDANLEKYLDEFLSPGKYTELVNRQLPREDRDLLTPDLMRAMSRLIVNVCLLMTNNSELVSRDIPTKFLTPYNDAVKRGDRKAKADLEHKISRSGTLHGHTIGSTLMVPSRPGIPAFSTGQHWKLSWGHLRRTHWRRYWVGPKESQTVVRKLVLLHHVGHDDAGKPLPVNPDAVRRYQVGAAV